VVGGRRRRGGGKSVLRVLADLAGMPPAGGVFLSGGSAANLSALAWRAIPHRGVEAGGGAPVAVTHRHTVDPQCPEDARHGGVRGATKDHRLTGEDLERALAEIATVATSSPSWPRGDHERGNRRRSGRDRRVAGNGASGSTLTAYGSAFWRPVPASLLRIERADSFVVDP